MPFSPRPSFQTWIPSTQTLTALGFGLIGYGVYRNVSTKVGLFKENVEERKQKTLEMVDEKIETIRQNVEAAADLKRKLMKRVEEERQECRDFSKAVNSELVVKHCKKLEEYDEILKARQEFIKRIKDKMGKTTNKYLLDLQQHHEKELQEIRAKRQAIQEKLKKTKAKLEELKENGKHGTREKAMVEYAKQLSNCQTESNAGTKTFF